MAQASDDEFADRVARCCFATFRALPKSGKPINETEWTCLAGIVAETTDNNAMKTVALATGSKVSTVDNVRRDGSSLIDSHAEVLCRRALRRLLQSELLRDDIERSELIERKQSNSNNSSDQHAEFQLRANVQLHLYVSCSPCGDCCVSRETTAKAARHRDTDDHASASSVRDRNVLLTGADPVAGEPPDDDVFHQRVGVLRGKPGRGAFCISLSCSDKLARWNVLGVQGPLLAPFLPEPIRFASIVIGAPGAEADVRQRAADRSLNERVVDLVSHRYRVVCTTSNEQFEFAQNALGPLAAASNAINWSCDIGAGKSEVTQGLFGLRNGVTKKSASSPKARSTLCKRAFATRYLALVRKWRSPAEAEAVAAMTYSAAKAAAAPSYQKAKLEKFMRHESFLHWQRAATYEAWRAEWEQWQIGNAAANTSDAGEHN
jgi:tRNA-specific adenosine deaminase 1